MQDCTNTIANTLELLQSCTKPSAYHQLLAQQELRTATLIDNDFAKCSYLQKLFQSILVSDISEHLRVPIVRAVENSATALEAVYKEAYHNDKTFLILFMTLIRGEFIRKKNEIQEAYSLFHS